MPNTETLFVIVAAAAIVLQFVILLAMYLAIRKSQKRVEDVTEALSRHGVPVLEAAHTFFLENAPKVSTILDNVSTSTGTVNRQIERVDATVTDIVDRTRLQVIRADELVSRTLDRVEETTDFVHHRVLSPIRHAAGLISGVGAGIGALVGHIKGAKNGPAKNGSGQMF
jgi:ABC-type transporter Mla subunit MlaD